MNMREGAPFVVSSIFDEPWAALDDAALLAHLRSPRPVHIDLVVDDEECTSEKIEALMHGRFTFVGETHELKDPIAWLANPSADVEWHILLHKFYYAAGLGRAFLRTGEARYARRWATLVDGWMRTVPPGFIAADVTGRRVQNWIYSLQAFASHGAAHAAPLDPGLLRRVIESIHVQVEYLCANLTPKRNHRTLELTAIFLAGVAFPEMRRAAHWRTFALAETLENMRADLLADGVHCELSTDYHHLAIRNWLHVRTLAARHGVAVPAEMDALLERGLHFAMHIHKPDGGMPSLSDGDARGFLPLLAQGAALFGREDMRFVATQGAEGTPPTDHLAHFDASGYHVVRSGWTADAQYLVLDCGPLGEGNHGHFDCLSIELAAHGRSLVVDPGRYTYSEAGETNWRVHFRGTAAHNTVCVDGRNQTRYVPKPIKERSRHAQGSVRQKIAGPAPEASLIESAAGAGLVLLHGRCASHEYDAVHERCIVLVDGAYWIVADTLRAGSDHDYALNFQLAPIAQDACALSRSDGVRLASPGLAAAQPGRTGQQATLAGGWVSARYGHKERAPVLRTTAHGRDVDFDTVLAPWAGTVGSASVHDLPALGDAGDAATALRIHVVQGTQVRRDGWFHARGTRPQAWRLGALHFTGRWLHWREAADGTLLAATSHAGSTLHGPSGVLPLAIAEAA